MTVGVDIGTTSVKALAVSADGEVLARARIPHVVESPGPGSFEHDVDRAWRSGVCRAYEQVSVGLDVAGVDVAAMVPSMAAVDCAGHGMTPGLLYGDPRLGPADGTNPVESGEGVRMVARCASREPRAAGYWPAQAVANHALCGTGAIDTVVAMTLCPLFDFTGWDPRIASEVGVSSDQLPRVVVGNEPIGVTAQGVPVGPGTVDGLAEQVVAGADGPGDVLVILGTTMVIWAVASERVDVPGLWCVPHTAPGMWSVGGASNAGGRFVDWAVSLLDHEGASVDRARGSRPMSSSIPVWEPYPCGERTPIHDPHRRAALHDMDLSQGPRQLRRSVFEASAFVVRHHLELAGLMASRRRVVVTGGGAYNPEWVCAVADASGLPVDVVAVPEGAALGAAFFARITAGLEPAGADASRWARVSHRVDPDDRWSVATVERYRRFVELSGVRNAR